MAYEISDFVFVCSFSIVKKKENQNGIYSAIIVVEVIVAVPFHYIFLRCVAISISVYREQEIK